MTEIRFLSVVCHVMTVFGHKREKCEILLQFWFQFYFIAKNQAQASLHLHIPMIVIFISIILPIVFYNIQPNRGVATRDKDMILDTLIFQLFSVILKSPILIWFGAVGGFTAFVKTF